ncbi:MAG: hypothetical protein ACI9VT_001085 [Psychroserpens sp.]|jgi:hypothetical protein
MARPMKASNGVEDKPKPTISIVFDGGQFKSKALIGCERENNTKLLEKRELNQLYNEFINWQIDQKKSSVNVFRTLS